MTFQIYILYSKIKDCNYVGYSGDDLNEPLRKHSSRYKGFTGGVGDWRIVYTEGYSEKNEAIRREAATKLFRQKRL